MQQAPSSQKKPVSDVWRTELTKLPELTRSRRIFRHLAHKLLTPFFKFWLRPIFSGTENLPAHGPALMVINHLGAADAPAIFSAMPYAVDAFAKIELYDLPILGKLMHCYGVIWVHRGQPDRRAINAALKGFAEGRIIAIAPEGRQSLTGALEEGTQGAAYLALKADVPIIPIVVTGTEDQTVFTALKRLRRVSVTVCIGKPFKLEQHPDRKQSIRAGTHHIMRQLANMLPAEYRGIFQ